MSRTSGLIGSSCQRVIIGLGKTGMSCARYLAGQGVPFKVMDTRSRPPGIDELRLEYPDVEIHTGSFNEDWLMAADELIVSPGIALAEPAIARAVENGADAIGDIELFCRAVNNAERVVPVIAITGSNGKSTVTTLLGDMAKEAGFTVGIGGNIGTPALELLNNSGTELYVLELSSFQLETTHSLRAAAATVLNISADHMDRYHSLADYHQAKQVIYRGCATAVFNKEDALTAPLLPVTAKAVSFTTSTPDLNQYGLLEDEDGVWLSKGINKLLNTRTMKIRGRHNQMNALAALALGEAVDIELSAMLNVLQRFTGLPHRCQWLAEHNEVSWFNDSKATNVGATVAAITGLGSDMAGKIILIAGGDGKGADFSELREPVKQFVSRVILLGRDAPVIEKALNDVAPVNPVADMAEAVDLAKKLSSPGDAVLLAPACASFDMFSSFETRGDEFAALVKEQTPC